jgi:hypothetical protein
MDEKNTYSNVLSSILYEVCARLFVEQRCMNYIFISDLNQSTKEKRHVYLFSYTRLSLASDLANFYPCRRRRGHLIVILHDTNARAGGKVQPCLISALAAQPAGFD